MSTSDDASLGVDFAKVWCALEVWDRERPQRLEFPGCRVQFYMGAMEIPMLAFRPRTPVVPAAVRMAAWPPLLDRFDLVLDCVTAGENYKLNRRGTGEYVGRVLADSLKLHAERTKDLGPEALESIAALYLGLPRPGGDG